MDANINHQHGSVYRIEEIDIAQLVNLLSNVFVFSATVNLVIDAAKNEIYVEAPAHVSDEDERRIHDNHMIVPLDEVLVTDKLLEILRNK